MVVILYVIAVTTTIMWKRRLVVVKVSVANWTKLVISISIVWNYRNG